MTSGEKSFNVVGDTQVSLGEEKITKEELSQLQNIGVILGYQTNNYEIERIEFDTQRLREIAFEYSILEDIASSVEVDVMSVFRATDTDRLTTSEISEKIDKPASSVSRALSRLVEKNQIERVQRGVYAPL